MFLGKSSSINRAKARRVLVMDRGVPTEAVRGPRCAPQRSTPVQSLVGTAEGTPPWKPAWRSTCLEQAWQGRAREGA